MLISDLSTWPILLVYADEDWGLADTSTGCSAISEALARAVDEGIRIPMVYRTIPGTTPPFPCVLAIVASLVYHRKVVKEGLDMTIVRYHVPTDVQFLRTVLNYYTPTRNIYVVGSDHDVAEIVAGRAKREWLLAEGSDAGGGYRAGVEDKVRAFSLGSET